MVPSHLSFSMSSSNTEFYKRSNFVTHLPTGYLYSPTHYWIALEREGSNVWRVGFTKFATRMLGEVVDQQWEKTVGDLIAPGEILGSIEGFKAISDIYSIAAGTFQGGNEVLQSKIELISARPYDEGWLYRVEGAPDAKCTDLAGYRSLLDSTIDRILEKQGGE
jgi:glycine cleavage system H protein